MYEFFKTENKYLSDGLWFVNNGHKINKIISLNFNF